MKKSTIFLGLILILTSCHREEVGWISIKSTPTGADVYLDDSLVGQKTNCILENVPAGEHILRTNLAGYGFWACGIVMDPGDTVTIEASLEQDSLVGPTLLWKYGIEFYLFQAVGKEGSTYLNYNCNSIVALTPDGELRWKFIHSVNDYTSVIETYPLIGPDGCIFTTYSLGDPKSPGMFICALSPIDGSIIWEKEFGGGDPELSNWELNPVLGPNGEIYVPCFTCGPSFWISCLFAFDKNGSPLWEFKQDSCIISASPVIGRDGTIFFIGGYDNCYLHSVSPGGSLKWRKEIEDAEGGVSEIAIGPDGSLFFTMGNNMQSHLYAFNPEGSLKWKTEDLCGSPIIDADGTVYCSLVDRTNDRKYFTAVNADGSIKWKYEVCPGGACVGSDGTIYFTENSGNYIFSYLYALTKDGELLWKYPILEGGNGAPAITPGGGLYLPVNEYIYAFQVSSPGLAANCWPRSRHDNGNSGYAGGK